MKRKSFFYAPIFQEHNHAPTHTHTHEQQLRITYCDKYLLVIIVGLKAIDL